MASRRPKKKYGKKAQDKVAKAMRERKKGTLRSSGEKVRSRKQAVAIGLSEARREGGKVPPEPADQEKRSRKKSKKKSTTSGRKKSRSRKTR